MTDNTAKEEGKSSLKTSSLKLGAKTFKPPTKKPEQIQSADVTGAYNQSPLSTLNIGYDNSTTPFQLPNTFAIPNTTGMPPLGNISAYLPNMSMPPPPPPVQTASSLSMSSISKSSLVKSSRSFVPKTLKDSTGAEMPDPKAESGKPVLKLTTKTFTPKTTATVETTEDAEKETIEVIAPAQVIAQDPKPKEQSSVVTKTEEKQVDSNPVEPKAKPVEPEAKPVEPEAKPVKEKSEPLTAELSSKYPKELLSLISSYKANGKLTVKDLLTLKECEICRCSEKPTSSINETILTRNCERQIIFSKSFQKGGGRKHQSNKGYNNNFNKGTMKKKPSHGNGFERQQVSEDVKKLKVQASQWKEHIDKTDTENIELKTKELFNKISIDNMKRLREQIRDVLFKCKTTEDRSTFIKIMFKKATHEDKYCSMYTSLITYLGESETNALNQEAADGSPTKSKSKMRKAKESKLKKEIVVECKRIFEEFANEMNIEGVKESDREEFEYKYKKRLFGNLKFIAELYKKKLISKSICLHVLANLLGKTQLMKSNEFTIEGACTFLTRVGEKLEKQVLKTTDGEDESPAIKEENKEDAEKTKSKDAYLNIIGTLTNLQQDVSISSRVRILIQNTLHKKENNWVENIQDEGPKTKKQIREDHLRQLQGIDDTSQKKSPKAKKQQSEKFTDFSQLELTKMESSTSIISEYDDEIERREEPIPKEYTPREIEHMSHEAIKDRFIGNFVEWLGNGQINVEMFKKEENRTSGDKIIEFMLDKLYDKPENEVKQFNEYIYLIFKEDLFAIKDIEKAISSFFVTIPNIESDFPHLPVLFSDFLYYIFVEKNIADFAKVKIELVGDNEGLEEDEEPIYLIDIYFKILALFLTKIYQNYEEMFDNYYTSYNIDEIVHKLRPHISDEDLFNEIKQEYNIPENIISLLDVQID